MLFCLQSVTNDRESMSECRKEVKSRSKQLLVLAGYPCTAMEWVKRGVPQVECWSYKQPVFAAVTRDDQDNCPSKL